MNKLLDFLNELEERNICYKLGKVRDAIMVEITVPGERWEVEFFRGETVDIEVFRSDGTIEGENKVQELFQRFSG